MQSKKKVKFENNGRKRVRSESNLEEIGRKSESKIRNNLRKCENIKNWGLTVKKEGKKESMKMWRWKRC